jgi:GNAT superfamily N-acetyltransferase
MTWLAPLYLAGALAIAAPILFHLWRRTPQGRRPFSTLMFLTPSPPRMTRLSKVEHWALLSLRALALLLLALAFARPVWRIPATIPIAPEESEFVAILVDHSASLRRETLWEQQSQLIQQRIDDLPDHTIPALFVFDSRWSPALSFAESETLDPAVRRQLLTERMQAVSPSYRGTNLGQALVRTAQAVQDAQTGRALPRPQRILLVSDLQTGSDLRELLGYDWPDDLPVEWVSPVPRSQANAGLQLVEATMNAADDRTRVRITNALGATRQQLTLNWVSGTHSVKCLDLVVPPGQSRVVALPAPPSGDFGPVLELSGDGDPFDNRLWLPSRQPVPCTVLFVGRDPADDTDGLRYYLERALASNPRFLTTVVTADAPTLPVDRPTLVVAAEAEALGTDLLKKLRGNGIATMLVPKTVDDAQSLLAACGLNELDLREAAVRDYALWSQIDFESPWFAPFAEAQFADFSGIHFWRHRELTGDLPEGSQVLVRFDGGSPAIARLTTNGGPLWFFAAGWHPRDSQLARSSKFVPLMWRIMESTLGGQDQATSLIVGDPLPRPATTGECQITDPAGRQTPWPDDGQAVTVETPGLYAVTAGSTRQTVTVNLPPEESRTDPLPLEQLEAAGIKLSTKSLRPSLTTSVDQLRQQQLAELEDQQQLWRWSLVAAFGLLVLETALAAWRQFRHNSALVGD